MTSSDGSANEQSSTASNGSSVPGTTSTPASAARKGPFADNGIVAAAGAAIVMVVCAVALWALGRPANAPARPATLTPSPVAAKNIAVAHTGAVAAQPRAAAAVAAQPTSGSIDAK